MKKLIETINEELILEAIVSKVSNFKVKFDLTEHSSDRKFNREGHQYISNKEILFTLYKVAKQIKEDYNVNIININDNILITDKSRKNNYHIFATICEDKKDKEYLVIKVITHIYKDDFKTNDAKKKYITYLNDKDIEKRYKLKNIL